VSPTPRVSKVTHAVAISAAVCRVGALIGALLAIVPAGAAASPLPPQIHTVAGGGGCSGAAAVASLGSCDNVAATSVAIQGARSVAANPAGGYVYIDYGSDLVREVSGTGVVTTVAGTSTVTAAGAGPDTTDVDGVPATESGLDDPVAVAVLPNGALLITEYQGGRVRLVSPGLPGQAIITTIAGIPPTAGDPGPTQGDNGSSGLGTDIDLNYPSDAQPTASGGVLIADTYNNRIMLLSSTSPNATIRQIAGGGGCVDATSSCAGWQASQVQLDLPDSVSELPGGAGGYLVSEYGADAVRLITQESLGGTFLTIAGQPGSPGYSGDGGPAVFAQLERPEDAVSSPDGGVLIADTGNNAVREVTSSGVISTIAGDGELGYTGDGADATAAELSGPSAVAPISTGILIADDNNGAIREITQAPTTTIKIQPAHPNGARGWYKTDPYVTVSSTGGGTSACEFDPLQAPPAYGAITSGCVFIGNGAFFTEDGTHTFYAASENGFGDDENPISLTFNVDATPPRITCPKKPTFRYGKKAELTAVLKDSVSGPAKRSLKVRPNTRRKGAQTVRVRGTNLAGVSATVKCAYSVRRRSGS
jgi:hypothetical protein